MKCKELVDKLGAYLDGELDERTRTWVEKHLQDCSACRREIGELQQLSSYLDDVPGSGVRANFSSEVREKAEERRLVADNIPYALLRDLRRLPNAAAAFVAVALGILLGAFMSQSVAITDAARHAAYARTEQAGEMTEVDYHIQALSATPESSLEQAYLDTVESPASGTATDTGSD